MLTKEIKEISNTIHAKLIDMRRKFHQNPELAFEEYNTAKLISEYLKSLHIETTTSIAKTGIVGLIRGKHPGRTVALRADIDALPLFEENNAKYKSLVHGKMHACGHDVHMTCLLGAAEILSVLREHLYGNIKLIFQPAEEGNGGALPMIEAGILEHPHVDTCIAAHVWPEVSVGKILVKHGAMMASPDNFEIIVKGKGGHGAKPHTTVDPIIIGCQIVNVLQTVVSRKINPLNPAVISVCYFQSGTCENVIPDTAVIKGTARSLDPNLRKEMPQLIEDVVSGITKSMGGDYEFNYTYLYPPTINDTDITNMLAESASKIIGKENVVFGDEPSMGGDDFAYFAEKVPSTYFRLGSKNENKGITYPLHNSRFDVDEDCISIGASVMAQFAVDYLMNDK